MVPGHRALLGILVLWPQSLCREWAHANGSGPNPSPNDPHVTHAKDFLLHPRGRFRGRMPTPPSGRWCRGLQITPRRGCRGCSSASPTSSSYSSTNIMSGTFPGSTTFGGVRNLSGTKGEKIVLPGPPAPRWISVPSVSKTLPRFCWTTCHVLDVWQPWLVPGAICRDFSGGSPYRDMKTTLVSAAPRNGS